LTSLKWILNLLILTTIFIFIADFMKVTFPMHIAIYTIQQTCSFLAEYRSTKRQNTFSQLNDSKSIFNNNNVKLIYAKLKPTNTVL